MKRWDQRPLEIRNLFNPAFCGLVLYRAFRSFEEQDARGMPFSLSLLILPLCFQKETRELLQSGSRGYFLKVVTNNPQIRIDFDRRAFDLLPFSFEALGLLMQLQLFEVTGDGRLKSVEGDVKKTISGTPESVSCQRVAKFLGKEFARIADRTTIYTTLGVRP